MVTFDPGSSILHFDLQKGNSMVNSYENFMVVNDTVPIQTPLYFVSRGQTPRR